jgi:uncharacterized protein (DUF983 family)
MGSCTENMKNDIFDAECDEYCPKCDSGDTYNAWAMVGNIETHYSACEHCGHQWNIG